MRRGAQHERRFLESGGAGGGVYNPMAGNAQQFLTPGTGSAGTQGCVKIRLVLGS